MTNLVPGSCPLSCKPSVGLPFPHCSSLLSMSVNSFYFFFLSVPLSSHPSFISFDRVSCIQLRLASSVAEDGFELLIFLSSSVSCGITMLHVMQNWGCNLGLPACKVSTLPTKLHPQPLFNSSCAYSNRPWRPSKVLQ